MIKILIADDSPTETELLKRIIEEEKDMTVVGCASNGKEAVLLAERLKPDLITMDIEMPVMNGLDATQLIMQSNPVPIVVISATVNNKNLNTVFLALEAGALSVMDKVYNAFDPKFKQDRKRMIDLIRAMADIKVVKRRFNIVNKNSKIISNIPNHDAKQHLKYEILAIGASVGGPLALKMILSALPADFPVPIVVVQHMIPGYVEGLCNWLNNHCALRVKCAEDQELLRSGTVYFAPDNHHLHVVRKDKNLISNLQTGLPVSGFCPSITELLHSVSSTSGQKAVGILLTGMGSDGAQGLLELKQNQGHTLIQDSKSSVVFGMAGVADSLGAVDKVINLDQFASYLTVLFGV